MKQIFADVNVPYRVVYIPRRGRAHRDVKLWTRRQVSLAAPSASEAPPAFRITSANPSHVPETPYVIRSFDQAYYWPVLDRARNLKNADDFLAGLASGTYDSLRILNPALLWFSGHQPTYEGYFAGRAGDRILENDSEISFAEIQRGAARMMLCGEVVYFAGGAPAFFGRWSDHCSDRSMALHAGSLARGPGPSLWGAAGQLKEEARREGHVFDVSRLDREIELLEARGISVDLLHTIESIGDVTMGDDALHLCADAVVRRLLAASSAISTAYLDLIPARSRHDGSEWIPLDICRTILDDAVGRRWPRELGWAHLSVALAHATDILRRLGLGPEDEEALASL